MLISNATADRDALGSNPESCKIATYPAFDWLRIALASIVALGHEGVKFPGPIDGDLAVQVFFALSGWLIGGILLKSYRSDLPRFFFNRATRIWIPYAVAVGALYGFAAIYKGIDFYWFKYLFFDSTFTHQLFTHFPQAGHELPLDGSGNQFWSISVEEQFYLVAPAVMLVPFGRKLMVWISIAAALIFGRVLGAPIALGVIAAILHRDYPDWHLVPTARIAAFAVTALLLVAMFLTGSLFLRPLFAVGVVVALAVPGRRTAVAVFAGGISYPVYLNHWMGAFVAHGITRHVLHAADDNAVKAMYVVLAYLASLVIGSLAYLLIDRQVLNRREAWFTRARGISLGAAAYVLVVIGILGGLIIA